MTVSGMKKIWQEVRDAAQIPWFRQYDTRHTGATRLAEAGVPTEVIVARMGHATDKMRRHYTHVSNHAQRQWLRGVPQVRAFAPPAASYQSAPASSYYVPPQRATFATASYQAHTRPSIGPPADDAWINQSPDDRD